MKKLDSHVKNFEEIWTYLLEVSHTIREGASAQLLCKNK